MAMTENTAEFPVTVSVITPAYNAAQVLARAVASVQAQTLQDWEMIIVDDGSADSTYALAQTLARDAPRLRVLRHESGQGAAAARNTAIEAATGRYIAFLDVDDEWTPTKLDQQIGLMQGQGAALSYTGFLRITDTVERFIEVPARVTRTQLLFGNIICCSSAVYDRAALGTVLMPPLPLRQDYALWLTLLAQTDCAVGIDAPLVRLHVTRGSLSSNKVQATRATYAMHRGYFGAGAVQSALYVACHTLRRWWRG